VIIGYTVEILDCGGKVLQTLNTTNRMLNVKELLPFRVYGYRIAAYTSAGVGPFTNCSTIQTLQDGKHAYTC